MKITDIKDKKDLLTSSKRKTNAFYQLEIDLKYNEIYEFGINIT